MHMQPYCYSGTLPFFTECNTDTRWIVAASMRFLRSPSHPGILQPRIVTIYSCRAHYHTVINPFTCNRVPFGRVNGQRFVEYSVVIRNRVSCDLDLCLLISDAYAMASKPIQIKHHDLTIVFVHSACEQALSITNHKNRPSSCQASPVSMLPSSTVFLLLRYAS